MSYRVLLIEDEAGISDFISRGLKEEGFTVEWASDGNQGWKSMQMADWDAILLDWWLPGQDGMELLKQFRKINSHTPVLFLTARDEVENRVKGLDAGADDYLCKPFSFDELLARLRALIRRHARGDGTLVSYGDVQVNLESGKVDRAGKSLVLTTKECALLVYFIRHANEVLSRNRIYESVWNETYDGFSNTLEVHVMELRKKLESAGLRLIHTVRGKGYLFGEVNEES